MVGGMASLNVGNLGEYLREQRRTAQLSLRQLADAAGVSNPYLSQIERGLRKPSAEVLQQVAKALRISAETLYVRAGILDERERDELETRAVILADPSINERQKQVLLQIYESFRKENGFEIDAARGRRPPRQRRPTGSADGRRRRRRRPRHAHDRGSDADPPLELTLRSGRTTVMAITDDLRKTLTDPTPLYFAAGTADLAVQQAKKVPAPDRAAARPRPRPYRGRAQHRPEGRAGEGDRPGQGGAGDRAGQGHRGASATLDTDLKKLGETAQDLALRGVGVAAEYAVKARETYEKVAEHGEQAVRTWRGEAAEEIAEIAVAVEPEPTEPSGGQGGAEAASRSPTGRRPQAEEAAPGRPQGPRAQARGEEDHAAAAK